MYYANMAGFGETAAEQVKAGVDLATQLTKAGVDIKNILKPAKQPKPSIVPSAGGTDYSTFLWIGGAVLLLGIAGYMIYKKRK